MWKRKWESDPNLNTLKSDLVLIALIVAAVVVTVIVFEPLLR